MKIPPAPIPVTLEYEHARTSHDPHATSRPVSTDVRDLLRRGGDDGATARYSAIREIARGGMGRIVLADDRRLGRRVAMKEQLREAHRDIDAFRFLEEARATAQLEHPNIVPIHDLEVGPDGRAYFTMRYVEGRSLGSVLNALHEGDDATIRAFPLSELLLVFLKICDAVAYAHDRGVVHRDLKPENVMLGQFGEVFVMDWGIARVQGTDAPPPESAPERHSSFPPVSSVREAAPEIETLAGSIIGTPGYMAPEQIRGNRALLGPRVDVFALGVILYEMLTLERLVEGTSAMSLIGCTLIGAFVPPRERAPQRNVSARLEEIVMKALAVSPERRWQTVVALREAVANELEGSREAARRRAMAAEKTHRAQEQLEQYRARLRDRDELSLAHELRRVTLPVDDAVALAAHWRDEAQRARLEEDVRNAFWDVYGKLVGAVQDDPSHVEAKIMLVDLLLERAVERKARGDVAASREMIALAREHDPERVATLVDAPATLTLESEPAGMSVRVSVVEEEGPLLVERPCDETATTPCALSLSPGSHVIDLEGDDGRAVRVTVSVAAGERAARRVELPPVDRMLDGYAFVPGGEYVVGGDALAAGHGPRRIVRVESFFIAKRLVTMAEYGRFLTALARRDAGLAASHAPRAHGRPSWMPNPQGDYATPWVDPDGDEMLSDFPVFMIGARDADAYVAWVSEALGRAARLPTSDEWEIAARGADERIFPWGNGFDPALCWMRDSRGGDVRVRAVGTRPLDRSPFGLFDIAGLVREWTSATTATEARITRGGAWPSTREQCRIGRIDVVPPGESAITVGLRVVLTA